MFKAPLLVLSACLLALALAACGSSSSSSSSSSASRTTVTVSSSQTGSAPAPAAALHGVLAIAANPQGQLKFDTSSLSAKAGKVTFAFTNSAPLQHNLTIEQGSGGTILGATPTFTGGTKTIITNLTPGTYAFFCSVPGHRAAGMQGKLTVR